LVKTPSFSWGRLQSLFFFNNHDVAKGRSSRKIQQEFPEIRKTYWGCHFWGRGFFSSTNGNVTDDIINNYINNHSDAHQSNNVNNISLE
jgi:putative transposase